VRRVAAEGITITFGGVDVVSGVDLDLQAGEIHAIVGENGAGKSSLAKAIAGVYQPRLGRIVVGESEVRFRNPREALRAGVALIHQEPLNFPDLSVAENIFAGHPLKKGGLVDWPQIQRRATELLAELGVSLDPKRPMQGLSTAQQQQVELACALSHDATVWIFDETTASLTPKEVAELFAIMRRLRDQGYALAVVSHHLHEVFAISDRITVLRDGAKVAERKTSETNEAEIVRLMVGRDLAGERFASGDLGAPILEVEEFSGSGFSDVTLNVRAGEIVGLAGLVGAGRTELARAIFGISRANQGVMKLEGQAVAVCSPQQAQKMGIGLVPEDRRHDGLLMPQPISFNASLIHLRELCRMEWLNRGRIDSATEAQTARLKLSRRSLGQPVEELSGGNQQKVVLAKWLMTSPKLLILDEPTRGVDVGAKHEVHTIIRELANQGMAVLMISSDLPEVLRLSDRVYVMRQGRIAAEMPAAEATEEKIMFAATGQSEVAIA
jgi:rhamnose transport system ATP-binding protein